MREVVKSNRLKYSFGTLGWINFYGIPIFLILGGLFFLFKDLKNNNVDTISISMTILGVLLYLVQERKLRFNRIKLNTPANKFAKNVREVLQEDGWEIEYDNKNYIQAVNRTNLFSLDLLTIKYLKNEIRWNLVHHPESHNSIAALFSLNLKSKKTIKKIIASA